MATTTPQAPQTQTPPSAGKTLAIMFGTLAFPFVLAAAVFHLRKK